MNTERKSWRDDEIEIIVMDYFAMLQLELTGKKYVKAERNRMLQRQLDRSKGSIEFKHQNISAVLEMLGFPYIEGYKPRKNFQTKLFEIIDHHLSASNLLEVIFQPASFKIPRQGMEFVEPPSKNILPDIVDQKITQMKRKIDYAGRDARARALGKAGEEYFYQSEQNRLSEIGRDDLADKVRWISEEDGDDAGYDILSYTANGETRCMEVKTTNGLIRTPFYITRNELRVSEEKSDVFRLVRLYDFARKPGAYQLIPPLKDHINLQATQYLASF